MITINNINYKNMFIKKVPAFSTYIKESLFIDNWTNFKDGTNLGFDTVTREALMISETVLKLLDVNTPDMVSYTTNNTSFGEDFLYFSDMVSGLQPIVVKTLDMPGYVMYFSSYDYNGNKVLMCDVVELGGENCSYVFITQDVLDIYIGDDGSNAGDTPSDSSGDVVESGDSSPQSDDTSI